MGPGYITIWTTKERKRNSRRRKNGRLETVTNRQYWVLNIGMFIILLMATLLMVVVATCIL